MAIKIKKKQSTREEAKAPDQILTVTGRLFNFIEKQRVHLAIGLGVLLLAIIVITALSGHVRRKHTSEGSTVLGASLLLTAPVGPEAGETSPFIPTFPTREARTAAVEQAVQPLIGKADAPAAAELVAAVASFENQDMDEAQGRYRAAAEAGGDTPLGVMAYHGLAVTQAQSGDLDGARLTLSQVAGSAPSLALFFDLENARWTEASGDLAAAHELYQALADRRTGSGELQRGPDDLLFEVATNRAELLAVALGIPEAAADEEAPEEVDLEAFEPLQVDAVPVGTPQ